MLAKIKSLWANHGFEIILGLCVAFILLFALYNKIAGTRGTYSRGRYFIPPRAMKKDSRPSWHRQPPRESKGEAECRRALQHLFGKPFPSQRPDFLRNPVTGGHFNLELDCYNAELKLAVEYNGVQHYKYVPYFHRNKDHFMNQKYRDDMKRRMCKQNGITLIEVPHTVQLADIKSFLLAKCRKMGYKV